MGRTKKQSKTVESSDYKYGVEIYPDSESYDSDSVLDFLKSYFQLWVYVLHDRDLKEDGTKKKPHIHFLGIFQTSDGVNSPRKMKTVQAALEPFNVPASAVYWQDNLKGSIRYLGHADHPEKAPYEVSEIKSNFPIEKYFQTDKNDFMSKKIFDYIISHQGLAFESYVRWAIENGCWSEFRRGFAVWSNLIREVNGAT